MGENNNIYKIKHQFENRQIILLIDIKLILSIFQSNPILMSLNVLSKISSCKIFIYPNQTLHGKIITLRPCTSISWKNLNNIGNKNVQFWMNNNV